MAAFAGRCREKCLVNFSRYLEIIKQGPVLRLILVAMVARIPHAAAGVVLTLHVVNTMGLRRSPAPWC